MPPSSWFTRANSGVSVPLASMAIRINEAITDASLMVDAGDGTFAEMSRAAALELAAKEGADLVEVWERPHQRPPGTVFCRVLRLRRPVVWERASGASGATDATSAASSPTHDPALWFRHEHCDGMHYVIGNPHTFPGRLSAWCTTKNQRFRVSKSEIAECSRETTYYLKGFLAGQEPGPPVSADGDVLPPDDPEQHAWIDAADLFLETGIWSSQFRICEQCGARLLPSNPREQCWHAHRM